MNYRAQLKGWAVDRVIEKWKAASYDGTTEELFEDAEKLVEYCYIPERDFDDSIKHLAELIKLMSDGSEALTRVNQLQAELGVLQEEIERQITKYNASNALQKETVQ